MTGLVRMKRTLWFVGLVLLHADLTPALPPQVASSQPASPTTVENPYAIISRLAHSKQWKEVAASAAEIHSKNLNDPIALYWLGISHLKLHEPVGAVQAFRAAEKLGLNTAPSHEGLALAYYDLNQFWLFEEQMKEARSLDPGDSTPDYYLGLYRLTIRSDVAGALGFFEEAIQLQPNDRKSLYQAGNCLEQLGNPAAARDHYVKAISLAQQDSDPFSWPYQGMTRLLLDDKPEAALDFAKKAVSLQPNEYSNHLILAKVYERLGNLVDAIHEAEVATVQNPTDSTSRYALYKLYRRAGDPRSAKELRAFEEIKALYDRD